jgi:hypothetical protein
MRWCVVSLIDRGLATLNVWSCALLSMAEPQSSPQRHYSKSEFQISIGRALWQGMFPKCVRRRNSMSIL